MKTEINDLVRENVKRMRPYSCARDEFSGQASVFLDANESPYGNLNRYPDPLQKELRREISLIKNIPGDMIFIGNGSDEAIDLCYRIFCTPGKDKVLLFPPTYGMYEVAAEANDIEVIKLHLDESFGIDISGAVEVIIKEKPKLVFVCSPNNPTGNSMRNEDIVTLLETVNGIVAVDEAYIDFSTKPSLLPLIEEYPNLVVLHTFSKAYGMAAARIGMAFSGKETISLFSKMKYPYNISSLNQSAVLDVIRTPGLKDSNVADILAEKKRLEISLASLKIVEKVFPSDANFLLIRVREADYVYKSLLDLGIVTRNRNSVVEGCIRITVGTAEENEILINSLKKISL
ncbi:MAG: histidinol-phosphate transaminase [Bacteroidales bacterium]|nr:histidinol-phosphate transaminase [Bacteroidales bacterium]